MTTQRQREQGQELGRKLGVRWDRVAFSPEQLAEGAHHELEHTRSLVTAAKIALDHLRERPDYYKKLEQCLPERKTRKRNVPVPKELKQDVWYHGTPSDAAAEGILTKGLKPGHGAGRWAHQRTVDLSPLAGAVYLTRSQAEAIRYAGGLMGASVLGDWGYVFRFQGSELGDIVPDEDYVGAAAWAGAAVANPAEFAEDVEEGDAHLRHFAQLVWEDHYELGKRIAIRVLSKWPSARSDLEIGFDLPRWGKRALPLLSDEEKAALLRAGAPAAHFGKPLKPSAAWRFRRMLEDEGDPDEEEALLQQIRDGTSLRALDAERIL